MSRTFLSNLLFVLLINLLVKPVYLFGIERSVQNRLPEESYGLFFILLNFTYLFQIVNDFGLQNFNNRHIAQHRQLLGKYFSSIAAAKGLLSLVFLLLVMGLGSLWFQEPSYLLLLLPIALNQVLNSLLIFLRSNMAGLGWYRVDSFFSSLDKLLMILLMGAQLLGREEIRIHHFVYTQTTTLTLTVLLAVFGLRKQLFQWRWMVRPAVVRWALRESFPYAMVTFLMLVYTYTDGVMLEWLLTNGRKEADVYAAGYRLLDVMGMIGYLMAGLLLPMFARLLKEKADLQPLVDLGFRLLWGVGVIVSVNAAVFGSEIMEFLYVRADAYMGRVFSWLAWSFLPWCLTYIFGTLLTASGRLWPMIRLFVFCVGLNVLLNSWVIPAHQAAGAAVATLLTQSLAGVGQVILVWVSFKQIRIGESLMRGAFLLGIIGLSSWIIYTFAPLDWGYRLVLGGTAGLLWCLLTQTWKWSDWQTLVNKRQAFTSQTHADE